MIRAAFLLLIAAVAGAASTSGAGVPTNPGGTSMPPFAEIVRGPAGGSIQQGVIPDGAYPRSDRQSLVYFPPGYSAQRPYPTLYVLHGIRGSPYSIAFGLGFASFADRAIIDRRARPFLAVMPPAGLTPRFNGEWSGPWESYLVDGVIPWVEAHLPVLRGRRDRAIAGLSAGGYGAVDIGLRHPGLFGTIESWSGSFSAPHDGSLRHAAAEQLAAHNPTVLVERKARLLRAFGTRFFLSCGTGDPASLVASIDFAGRLSAFRLPRRTYFVPGHHNGRLWRAQLPAALAYAFPIASTG